MGLLSCSVSVGFGISFAAFGGSASPTVKPAYHERGSRFIRQSQWGWLPVPKGEHLNRNEVTDCR